MATLNTLRTRGALFLSIVIGVALIAFLLGDLTSASSIFQSRKNRVGVVDGTSIDYLEFAGENEQMNRILETMYGRSSLSTEEHDRIREMVWESFIRRYSYDPGFRHLGIGAGEAEQIDMVQGQYISPVIQMMFTSPQTGLLDQEAIRGFVAGLEEDTSGRMPALWQFAKSEMVNERTMSKFMTLVTAGVFVNDLETGRGVEAANNTYTGHYAMVPFSTIADSLVNVTSSEVKKYYREHRDNYRQTASRDIEYVVFSVSPSETDYTDAADYINTLAEEFAAAADPMQFASFNSHERPDDSWRSESALSTELAAIAFGDRKGEMAGPTLSGDFYTMSRVAGEAMMPDSVGARHILLDRTRAAAADSLAGAIRRGASIFDLAPEYSLDPTVDLGVFAPEMMVEPFADAVRAAASGEVLTVNTQYGTHVVQMTYRSPLKRKVQIATVTYTIEPSAATEQAAYNQARDFLAAAAGSKEKFDAAVTSTGASLRVATIGEKDRDVRGLSNSRELVRWSFNSKPGVVSPIFDIDGDYVVAVLSGAKEAGFATVRDVASQIMTELRTDAKVGMITSQIEGKSIDEIAAMEGAKRDEFPALKVNAFYEPSMGMEPAVIGSVEALTEGVPSKPIKGYAGMYVVVVDSKAVSEDATDASERVRLEATAEGSLQQRVMQAMLEGADVKDFRAKFF